MFHKAEIEALERRCQALEDSGAKARRLLERQGKILQLLLLETGWETEDVPPVPAKTLPAEPGFVRLKRIGKAKSK